MIEVSNQPEKPYDPVLTLLSRSVLSHDLDLLENLPSIISHSHPTPDGVTNELPWLWHLRLRRASPARLLYRASWPRSYREARGCGGGIIIWLVT